MSEVQELLARFGTQLAVHLSAGKLWWKLDKLVGDTAIKLGGADGMEITLWCHGSARDGREETIKFEVSGAFPPDTFVLSEEEPRINVSYKRGARAVAGDIERRFLSKYVPLYYKKLEIQQGIERSRAAHKRVMATLSEAFGWNIVHHRDGRIKRVEESHYGSNADAILGDSMRPPEEDGQWYVDLTLKRIPIGVALRIADMLKEPRFPPEQLALL
jgi:hypothetical protein